MTSSVKQTLICDLLRCLFVLIGALAGLCCTLLPVQHYLPLGRYQHYALGVALLGLGYILQLTVSWFRLSPFARFCYLVTGLFWQAVAYVLWSNPWLDWRVAVQTESKEPTRLLLLAEYVVSVCIIWLCWLWLWAKELRCKKRAKIKDEEEVKR